jgi:hypothetical protein
MRKIMIGVCVAAFALAACGGGASNKVGVGSSGGGSATTAPGGGSTGGNDAFSQLIAKAKSASFKATYTTSDGKSITLAQDGNGKEAFITDGSEVISNGTTTISCDGTTSAATCTDLGSTGGTMIAGLTALFSTAYTSLAGLNSSVYGGHTSSETIAGRDASCVTIKASDYAGGLGGLSSKLGGDASVTSCVDKSLGYLLKLSGTDASGTATNELVATAAGDSSASDFQPPSTPVTTPSISLPPGVSLPPGITIPSGVPSP